MSGLKVKCPNCKQICFETTDKYDPDVSARGDMLKSLMPYHLDFLLSATTLAPYLTCPKCGDGQLAPSGRLWVIEEPKTLMETEEAMVKRFAEIDKAEPTPNVGKPAYICDVCGKELKTAGALTLHKRSHKGEANNG